MKNAFKKVAVIGGLLAFAAVSTYAFKEALEYLHATRVKTMTPPVFVPVVKVPKAVAPDAEQGLKQSVQTEEIIEAVAAPMPMPQETDSDLALAMAALGQISFEDDKITVRVPGEDGAVARDFVYDFNNAGAICDDSSPICLPMSRLSVQQKEKLDSIICYRAQVQGGEAFYQEYCKPS